MSKVLNTAAAESFLSRHPINPDMVGRYGIVVRDGNSWIDVFRKASGIGFLDITGNAAKMGYSDMADGDIRQIEANKGTVEEAGIFDAIAQIPGNLTYDPSLLESGLKAGAGAVSGVFEEAGKDLGALSGGISQGLFNIKVFGIPLPLLLIGGALVYGAFMLYGPASIIGRRRA